MRVLRGLPAQPLDVDCAVTIGAFDGVHIGHRALIERTLERARAEGNACLVITFDPHPVEVLAPQAKLRYLTSSTERARLIEAAGADFLLVLPFTEDTAHTPARDFVRPLVDTLRMRALVIGYDFTLGYKRQGNTQFLRQLGHEWGFSVDVFEPVVSDGEIVSSTRIRKLLESGSLDAATRLLGHRPTLSGVLGSDLTLDVDARRQTLPDGLYAGLVGSGEAGAPLANCTIRFQNGIPTLSHLPALPALVGREVVIEFAGGLPDVRGSYEEIEHTADVALRVRASTLGELLRTAAEGMSGLMADPASVPLDAQVELIVSGDDDAALLVNWLNELLYQFEMSGQIFRDFDISFTSEHSLRAVARGGRGRVHRRHVKAATFNDLHIARRDGQLDATIVFDI